MTIRVTANWIEVLRSPPRPKTRVTANWLEVLRSPPRAKVRATAMWLEILGDPLTVNVTYETVTNQSDFEVVNEPLFYETVVGAIEVGVANFPLVYESETSLSFYVAGDLTAGPLVGSDAIYTNITAVAVAEISSPPVLVVYQNITQAYSAIVSPAVVQYRTVTAVAAREAMLNDGRRDLLGGRLYKR